MLRSFTKCFCIILLCVPILLQTFPLNQGNPQEHQFKMKTEWPRVMEGLDLILHTTVGWSGPLKDGRPQDRIKSMGELWHKYSKSWHLFNLSGGYLESLIWFCTFMHFGNISYYNGMEFEVRKSELKFHLLGQVIQFLNVFICRMWITISNSQVMTIKQDKAVIAFCKFWVITKCY